MTDPVDTTFGSDQHGLVWGYRFSEGVMRRRRDW